MPKNSAPIVIGARPRVPLNWVTIIAFSVLHIGAIAALFTFSWPRLITSVVLYWATICLGISLGYHRLHTHRSYQIARPIEYFFGLCGAMTLQGGPISWVAIHRLHHQRSDQPEDPHSPRERGGWWAHLGWMVVGDAAHNQTHTMSRYAPDLGRQPYYRWLNTYHWVPTVVLAALLFAIAGPAMVCWAVCLRIVLGWHATWLVNSATHMWGQRRFNTTDDSRNNWWVALMTFGEGWHNNHHAHPTSARHGLAWYELDLSWIQISLLKYLGIAKSVRVAKVTSVLAEREAA